MTRVVEDRNRQDEQGQQHRRDGRPGGGPARSKGERGEHEAKQPAARVSHEHRGLPPGAQVVRQEARAGKAEGEGEGQDELVSWSVAASIAKYLQATAASVAARPSMLSSRLNALVIPTSQTTATIVASRSFPISSTCRPAAIAMPAAANCATSFASGLRCRTSSTSPAAKRSAAPARIPASSRLGSSVPVRPRRGNTGEQAEEDADAAEGRRAAVVPALAGRMGDEVLRERRVQEEAKGEPGSRQGGDRRGRGHNPGRVEQCVRVSRRLGCLHRR